MLVAADGETGYIEFINLAIDTDNDYVTAVPITDDESVYTDVAIDAEVLAAIVSGLDSTLTDELTSVDAALELFMACGVDSVTDSDTDCSCGGVFDVTEDDGACDGEIADDSTTVSTIENWVGYAKVSTDPEMPYFSSADLATFAAGTGAWEDASCNIDVDDEDNWVEDCE